MDTDLKIHRKFSKILPKLNILLMLVSFSLLAGCPSQQNTKPELGAVKNAVGDQTQSQLIRCKAALGTAALVENDIPSLEQIGLPSPIPLLRFMMTKSGCFTVVDRGRASNIMLKERELLKKGELQEGTGPTAGQMVAADYLITPDILFHDEDAGGHSLDFGLGGVFGGVLGLVAGGIDTTKLEAQTLLSLTNVRTGIQEAIAEGSATKHDVSYGFGLGGLSGFGLGASMSAYEDTDIGKLTAFAFQDAYNKLIADLLKQL